MAQMTRKRLRSPSGIPSHPGAPAVPPGWTETQLRDAREYEAELDRIVQPIIAARGRAFLLSSLPAVHTEPSPVYGDEVAPSADEQDQRDRKTERRSRQALVRQLLHRALARIVELVPGATRQELVDYITECFPARGPHRPAVPLDPDLVERAHAEIRATWHVGCREACQALATRLRVSRRTIEDLRSRKK